MQKRFLIPLILSFGVSAMFAFTIALTSNPPDQLVTKYTLYEGTTAIASITPTAAPTQGIPVPSPVPPGPHTYTATASNIRSESAKSLPVTLPDVPTAPAQPVLLP